MDFLFPLLLWLSQAILGSHCGSPVTTVIEHNPNSTFVGAISEDEACGSAGFVLTDGTLTFENRTD